MNMNQLMHKETEGLSIWTIAFIGVVLLLTLMSRAGAQGYDPAAFAFLAGGLPVLSTIFSLMISLRRRTAPDLAKLQALATAHGMTRLVVLASLPAIFLCTSIGLITLP